MANALEVITTNQGTVLKLGHFQFGFRGGAHGSVKEIVHDGDTVSLNTSFNFSSRFLGIDTPEVSFNIRNDSFIALSNPQWTQFFASGDWKNDFPVTPALRNHLIMRIGDGTKVAPNHAKHAKNAATALEDLIQADLNATGKTKDNFEFFLSFGFEFLDVYGRLLCYLAADEKNFNPPQRKLSYNEQQLANGMAVPYFIYPNIQPFLSIDPFDKQNSKPVGFWKNINGAVKLQAARKAVSDARTAKIGVFEAADPLILLPYELRYIARKNAHGPDRFVIDLGQNGSNTILKPEKYFKIKNYEDRLFIPKEFVPLLTTNGWIIQ
jgi:endonuclease YncB( thermonuclease family)